MDDGQSPRGCGGGLDKSAAFVRKALRQGGAEASMEVKQYTRRGIVPDAFSLTTRVAKISARKRAKIQIVHRKWQTHFLMRLSGYPS